MKKIIKNLRVKDVFILILCVGLIVAQVWFDLQLPKYMMKITTLLESNLTTVETIVKTGALMLLCSIGSVASSVLVGLLVSRLATGFAMRLRANIFNTIQSFSIEQIKKFSTSSLITRTTNDVMHVQQVISMGLQAMIKAPIIAVWAISEMSSTNWQCSIATGIAVTILLTTLAITGSIALPKFKQMQTLTDNINLASQENLQGVRVIRAFNAENYEQSKFNKVNNKLTKTGLFTSRIMGILNPMMSFVMSSLSLSIYIIGAILINNIKIIDGSSIALRQTAFGEIMGFSSYASQVIMAFMMMTMIFIILPRASVSAKRIAEVLNTKTSITDGAFSGETSLKGVIEFENVSFKYPDADECILENISFKCNKGDVVAFIGSTGSGKSTLINLVPRFYDATQGRVLVDGIDVKDYNLKTLRNKIGYISQRAVLFSGSVSENISFGELSNKNITDEDIDEALSIACASNFVSKMQDKKDSFISRGGTNISGGQKQRLSIARAIARKPEILIFDDSFSALDFKTDRKLRNNLDKHLNETTRLIVAQRIGTIKNANLIIVLDEGKVVGQGTHNELINTCDVYKEIALSQLSEEEITNGTK